MSNRRKHEAGSTIVELAAALTIIAAILGGATTALLSAQNSLASGEADRSVRDAGRRVSTFLNEMLPKANPKEVSPLLLDGDDNITIKEVVDHDGKDAVSATDALEIEFKLAEGEADNGKDDNGDGRIDEGYISFKEGSKTAGTVIEDVLDLSFDADAGGITYVVTIGVIVKGELVKHTFSQYVAYRTK